MKIRKAKSEELQELVDLRVEYIKNTCGKLLSKKQVAYWLKRPFDPTQLEKDILKDQVLVMEVNEKLEAFAQIRVASAITGGLHVHIEEFCLSGAASSHGAALLQEVEALGRDKQAEQVRVLVNETAKAFFESLQYVTGGPVLKRGIGDEAIHFYPLLKYLQKPSI
jgi:hypothetical protein